MSGTNRSRLGRGLGALLGEDYLVESAADTELRTLPVGKIESNPYQPRQDFGGEEIADLSQSIRENGPFAADRRAPIAEP